MIDTFTTETEFGKGEVRSWASILDDKTRAQAEMISRSPVVEGYLALMPDAHFGYGPPVGSALKTKDAVMPYAVGVDIGCGMIAVETSLSRAQFRGKEGAILGHLRELIPAGVGVSHDFPLHQVDLFINEFGLPFGLFSLGDVLSLKGKLRLQFGTLGAGNHFVEVCENKEGAVWFVLHSGSRGIGNMLATMHFNKAKAFCENEGIQLENKELAYFPANATEADDYLGDMLWAQEYAFAQREAMMDGLLEAVAREIPVLNLHWAELSRINCHHNYAESQGDGTWLTRKGAIDASKGKLGIIPGSMGAATYIVRGKGCEEAYNTSPHGAGRLLGRKNAKKTLSEADFREQMKGKTWMDRDAVALLDEAPSAYKPIETVIADSADLVDTVTVLSQFINYKGL